MSFALVTPDGRYHGHVDSVAQVKMNPELHSKLPNGVRLLPDADFQKIAADKVGRVAVFAAAPLFAEST